VRIGTIYGRRAFRRRAAATERAAAGEQMREPSIPSSYAQDTNAHGTIFGGVIFPI